jgi:hypothetical protein
MMRRCVLVLMVSGPALSCGGPPKQTDLTPPPSREVMRNVPHWYVNPPSDPNHLLGPATATSRDLQLAVNKAQTEGRNQIARQLDLRFSSLGKRFQEEVGLGDDSQLLDQFTQVYKTVTDEVITGSRTREQEIRPEGGVYRVFVLMEMPIGAASQALLARIRAGEQMYTRFRASEAFRELEEEVAEYEAWRSRQRTPEDGRR